MSKALALVAALALGLTATLPVQAASCDMESMTPREFGKCMMDKIIRLPADGTPRHVGMPNINQLYGCVRSTPDGGTI